MNVVARVLQLIALAASKDEQEARTAASLACRLIRLHGLTVIDPHPDWTRKPRSGHTEGHE